MSNLGRSLEFPGEGCFVIAEIAQAHDGSLGSAHAYIDAVAEAGADAIKFQTHIAHAESTYDEPWRVKFSYQDDSRYDYWSRMEFTPDQWAGLASHAADRGLEFMSSPFSAEAVELLLKLGIKRWKVASGEIYNPELLKLMWDTRLPMLYSSGMSTFGELDQVTEKARSMNIPFGVFQCSSSYPTPPELWGLNVLQTLRDRYRCPVGLSDHSGKPYAAIAAAALGADMIELHTVFSRDSFGPDVSSSVTLKELKKIVEGVSMIRSSMDAAVDKDSIASKTGILKNNFCRSVALRHPLPGGSVLQKEDLTLKKPSGGIPYEDIEKLIGRALKSDKSEKLLLQWDDLE